MPDLNINSYTHHYEETGSGEPMLFLFHLCTRNSKMLVKEFAPYNAGLRIIIPDARIMGESAHTADVDPEDWVADVLGLLDALSIPSAHIMAESLGSRVALRFAADHPDRVKTLILNSTIAVSEPAGDEWRRNYLSNLPPERQEIMPAIHGNDWESVVKLFGAVHERDHFKRYFDGYELAKRVKAPTLITHGDINSSPVYPLEHSERLHELLPDSWLAVFPNNVGDAREPRPDDFWELVRRFIKEKG